MPRRGDPLLVLGASGLLGRYVVTEAARRHLADVHVTAHIRPVNPPPGFTVHQIDLRDHSEVRRLLQEVRPAAVLNCAGIVKSLCVDPYEAVMMNAALPHLVAGALGSWGGRLVHVSTDCVFSGNRGQYSEHDLADPVDLYGKTKLSGEVEYDSHLTVRTSFIGLEAPPARGLLEWFLAQEGAVKGFRRALWSGLTADTFAHVLLELATRREVVGLLHVAGEAVDKATLLRWAAQVFRKTDVTIEPVDEPVCDRTLRSERLDTLGIQIPPTRRMLMELAENADMHVRSHHTPPP